jgi:hypothetical protein
MELEQEGKGASETDLSTRAELVEYTINVETAGTLDSLVEAGNYSDAQKLIITGNIAYEDVNYVDVNMATVEVLDLSEATYESESIRSFLSDSTKIKEIAIPQGVTSIGAWAFDGCSSLTSITIPEGVTSIGYGTFYGCSSLTSITIPQSVTSIGAWAFDGCSSLTSITIPEGVTSIGYGTFYGCSSLTSITIPQSVTSIGEEAFRECSSLISINIPEGVTSIGQWTFACCSSLTSITIPEGVTSIGYVSFLSCFSLTSIHLPESMTSIGDSAFQGCSSLQKVICNSSGDINDLSSFSNQYCWLIINRPDGNIPMYGPNWQNVVINGVAENVKLPYHKEEDFTIPEEIKSIKKISYTMTFDANYSPFSYGIWRTIALPFTPTHITHAEKGTLAPFDSGVDGALNFWLREWTTEGLKDVTLIEPNHPYLIAMPYSYKYSDKYNISGDVTFSAENLTAKDLENNNAPLSAEGTDYTMYASFSYMDKTDGVYVLNSDNEFVNNSYPIYPYEAYLKANTATLRSVISLNKGRAATRAGTKGKRMPQIDDM